MVKHTQTIRWLLSVFDHFVRLALKGFKLTLKTHEQLSKMLFLPGVIPKFCFKSKQI